ncbi:MAG: hypothetical protein WAQ27_04090 [Candidatus Microsaccharimonas sp.]
MFQFTNDGWLTYLIVIIIAAFVLGSIIHAILNEFSYNYHLSYRKGLLRIGGIILGSLFIIGQILSVVITVNSDEDEPAGAVALAEHFGVIQGNAYPITPGETFYGTGGEASVQTARYYGTNVTVNLKPQSMLAIDFGYQERMAKLELTRTNISFIEDNDGVPSVKLYLVDYIVDKSWAYYDVTYGECQWNLNNFFINCRRDAVSKELVVSEATDRRGLGPVISGYFDSAELRLPTELIHATD